MSETIETLTVTVVGAGGKMGMRVSDNLQQTARTVRYCENSAAGQDRVRAAGRDVSETAEAAADADVVVLAVPDTALGAVSEELVPRLRSGAIVLTLDPAAAYAGLLARRDDLTYVVAHPCHPSVFCQRTTPEELADTFGGVAAPQHVVAALDAGGDAGDVGGDAGDDAARRTAEGVVRSMYAPVLEVHWVTVTQLAYLEPTLVEMVACMVGRFLKEALQETVQTVGVPEEAARAMLLGHIQVALANSLQGDNPFSDACLIAMDSGRAAIVKDDWKKIFDRDQLDAVIAEMLRLDTSS